MPEALRILSLFEHQFGMLWEPVGIRLFQKQCSSVSMNGLHDDEKKDDDGGSRLKTLIVAWDDAQIAPYFVK